MEKLLVLLTLLGSVIALVFALDVYKRQHLHGVIGDKPVAALEKLQGGFAFAHAGIAGEQHALTVDCLLYTSRCV